MLKFDGCFSSPADKAAGLCGLWGLGWAGLATGTEEGNSSRPGMPFMPAQLPVSRWQMEIWNSSWLLWRADSLALCPTEALLLPALPS